jgi:pSer/pThr/pTyr-binding forkhead associated (FHA) protein
VQPAVPEAEVAVNGIRLGSDPTPLLHGDKITVAGEEILVVEADAVGSTQFMSVEGLTSGSRPRAVAPTPSAGSGLRGRLVSLTDGREYRVDAELVFGREAGCDVVVTGKDVSRQHAQIVRGAEGYVIHDSSTNGTFVNGDRIEGPRALARADVIRIGTDEFRFYPETPPAPPPVYDTPAGAQQRLSDTMMGLPAYAPPSRTPPRPEAAVEPLASLLIRNGPRKGERIPIRVPVVNIGRAEYNDVVLVDESVSSAHAKLLRRDDIWVVVDVGSTNGTFIEGERVAEEAAIAPGTTLRFGELSVLFDPADAHEEAEEGGTKVIQALVVPDAPQPVPAAATPATAAPAPRRAPRPIVAAPPRRRSPAIWLVPVLLVLAAAVAAFVLLRGR